MVTYYLFWLRYALKSLSSHSTYDDAENPRVANDYTPIHTSNQNTTLPTKTASLLPTEKPPNGTL